MMTSRRNRTMLAVAATVASFGSVALMLALASPNGTVDEVSIFVIVGVVYPIVGGLIAARTGHPIGWLFCLIAFGLTLGTAMEQWATYAVETCPGCLPLIPILIVPGALLFLSSVIALVLVFLLFPSGHLPDWHGRLILRVFLSSMAVVILTLALRPDGPSGTIRNPIGLESLRVPLLVVFGIAVGFALASAAAAVAGLVIRYRRAVGVERQQMKWLSFVCATAGVLLLVGFPLSFVTGNESWISNFLWSAFFACLMVGIPIAVGLAIFRYRLYDIDRVVSRTVSYALVTAVLGGVFVLVALVPVAIVGSEDAPDWVIALATLLVVALFRPVRRRVQGVVDRRFNRARYNTVQTIEAFNAHLRDEVDLYALETELRSVVARTMQPSHVSLWVKEQA